MEIRMNKGIVAIAAALVALSLGSFMPDPAQAGGASSAPSKYNNQTSTQYQARDVRVASDVRITEFSSSSARNSGPKR